MREGGGAQHPSSSPILGGGGGSVIHDSGLKAMFIELGSAGFPTSNAMNEVIFSMHAPYFPLPLPSSLTSAFQLDLTNTCISFITRKKEYIKHNRFYN